MEGWDQDFDFYETSIVGKRAFIALDLAAARHAPFASHPRCVTVRVQMLSPRSDGLRSDEESDALFALEDRIVQALTPHGFVHVGRVVHGGSTSFVFYAPQQAEVGAMREIIGGQAPYAPEITSAHDADWSFYREALWPDAYAMQRIQNRRLMSVRATHEDNPSLEREIDHLAFFADESCARAAEASLAALGYRIDPLREEGDDGTTRWAVEFHRSDRLDEDRPNEITDEILDTILPLEGEYDGWGALIAN